jgi:hypothetical protein
VHRSKTLVMVSLLGVSGLMGGCAAVSVHPVSVADANNPSVSGIRFYQPTPYLLVTELPSRPQVMVHPGPMGMAGMAMAGPKGMAMHRPMSGPMRHRDHGPDMGRDHGMRGHHPMPPGRHGWHGGPQGRKGMMHAMMPMPPMHPMMIARKAQRVMMLQIIYLPDFSKPYVLNINNALSHHNNSIVLANGWELLGVNVKGHLAEPPPIRAIDAVPGGKPMGPGHPMPRMMRRPGRWGHPMHGMQRKNAKRGMRGPGMMRGMMHRPAMRIQRWHRMMIARRAAMMMGLTPGLYQFVYSPKTGQLLGLRRVRILPGMMPPGRMWMHPHMMWKGWKHGKKWGHPPAKKPAPQKPQSGATNP